MIYTLKTIVEHSEVDYLHVLSSVTEKLFKIVNTLSFVLLVIGVNMFHCKEDIVLQDFVKSMMIYFSSVPKEQNSLNFLNYLIFSNFHLPDTNA